MQNRDNPQRSNIKNSHFESISKNNIIIFNFPEYIICIPLLKKITCCFSESLQTDILHLLSILLWL